MKGYKKKLSKRNFYKHYSDYKWNKKIDDYCIKTYGKEVYEIWKNKGGKVIFVMTSRTGKSINSVLLYSGCYPDSVCYPASYDIKDTVDVDYPLTATFHIDVDLGGNKNG